MCKKDDEESKDPLSTVHKVRHKTQERERVNVHAPASIPGSLLICLDCCHKGQVQRSGSVTSHI